MSSDNSTQIWAWFFNSELGYPKLVRFLSKNHYAQRKLLNFVKRPRHLKVVYFSLDRPETKHKIQNTKCQLNFFVLFQMKNIKGQAFIFYFQTSNKKNFRWQLVFSIWCLVTGRSNEKNIDFERFFALYFSLKIKIQK